MNYCCWSVWSEAERIDLIENIPINDLPNYINRVCYQQDTMTYWILTSLIPEQAWTQLVTYDAVLNVPIQTIDIKFDFKHLIERKKVKIKYLGDI